MAHNKALQALKRFDALHADGQNFEKLNSSQFQFMVRMAIERDMLSDSLKVEITRRIRELRMHNNNLNELILKSPDTIEWERIKKLALRCILTRDAGVFSLLQMGAHLRGWSHPEYEIFRTVCVHFGIIEDEYLIRDNYGLYSTFFCLYCNLEDPQHFGARIKVDGKYLYSNYHDIEVNDREAFKKAKYLAFSDLVIQLCGYDSTILKVKKGLNSAELLKLSVGENNENWKGRLYEYCAKHKLPFPIYFSRLVEQVKIDEFESIVSIGEGNQTLFSFPHRGISENDAEQRVSQSLLMLITQRQTKKDFKRKNLAVFTLIPVNDYRDSREKHHDAVWRNLKDNLPKSPVERLRYYCAFKKHSAPKYIVSQEVIDGRQQLKVTVSVTTKKDQTISFYGLCSPLNRKNKVNKARQYVAINLLKKLQELK